MNKLSITDLRMRAQREQWDWPAATHSLSTSVVSGNNGNFYFCGWNRANPENRIRYTIFQYDPHRRALGIVRTGHVNSNNEAKRLMKIFANSLPDEIRTDPYISTSASANVQQL